jgi:hypothetical protein
MTYAQQALGTSNGSAIDPNMGSFSKELMMEQGPFVYFTFNQIHQAGLPPMNASAADQDARMFLAWYASYNPNIVAYISKVMLLHDTPIDKPKWVADKQVRFKQSMYNLYKASMQRVTEISASQGLMEADPMDHVLFMDWWKKHDPSGAAASYVLARTSKTQYQVPAQLFDFWKSNDQGNLAPPGSLLGLGLWNMMKRNWFWIGAGAVGGAAVYKMLQKRRARKELEQAETMAANCPSCK